MSSRTRQQLESRIIGVAFPLLLVASSIPPVVGPPPIGALDETVTVYAAGDIACGPNDFIPANLCEDDRTAALIEQPDAVLVLGDTQYDDGALEDFERYYDRTWGRFREITFPVVGNHEYHVPGADGFFDYFGERAGDGFYESRLGAWRLIALDSSCDYIDCGLDTEQGRWLRGVLAEPWDCTLVITHQPHFASADAKHQDARLGPLYALLRASGVDLVLAGHVHAYERLGGAMPVVIIGGGGKSLRQADDPPIAASEVIYRETSAILRVDLAPGAYNAELRAVDGTVPDRFSGDC